MEILNNRDAWQTDYRAGWLAHYEHTGAFNWKLYQQAQNRPLSPTPGIDLRQSRLLLISTAGAYLRAAQEPFDAAHPLGDYTMRLFPSDTPFEDLALAHTHYDHAAVTEDPEVLLPLGHLADMVAEGAIGGVAPSVVSYMGYQPDLSRVVDELIPAILPVARDLQVQAALLVPA